MRRRIADQRGLHQPSPQRTALQPARGRHDPRRRHPRARHLPMLHPEPGPGHPRGRPRTHLCALPPRPRRTPRARLRHRLDDLPAHRRAPRRPDQRHRRRRHQPLPLHPPGIERPAQPKARDHAAAMRHLGHQLAAHGGRRRAVAVVSATTTHVTATDKFGARRPTIGLRLASGSHCGERTSSSVTTAGRPERAPGRHRRGHPLPARQRDVGGVPQPDRSRHVVASRGDRGLLRPGWRSLRKPRWLRGYDVRAGQ